MKHTRQGLAQMQSLPLEVKIKATERRIVEWFDYWGGEVYVSRSGGKDSDVLGHIVQRLYPDIPQVFVNTGLEYDSVREHAESQCDVILKPEKSFLQVIRDYGYPIISKEVALKVSEARRVPDGYASQSFNALSEKNLKYPQYSLEKYKYLLDAPFRISNLCCDVMKKKPAHKYGRKTKRKAIIGTMAAESRVRTQKWLQNGCNGFDLKIPVSNPLSFWTEQDILQYIKKYNVQIAEAYGEVVYTDGAGCVYEQDTFGYGLPLTTTKCKRTGCVFCMFGITQDTDRFLMLKELEPQKYDYVMRGGEFDADGMWTAKNGLGYKFVIDWLNEHGKLNIKY